MFRFGTAAVLKHIFIHNATCCYDSGQEKEFSLQLLIMLLKLHTVATQAHTCESLTGHCTRGGNTPGNTYIMVMCMCVRILQNTRGKRIVKHARGLIMHHIPSGRLVSVSGRRHQHRGSVIKKLLLRAEASTNTHTRHAQRQIKIGKWRKNRLVLVPAADVAATAHATFSVMYLHST